MVKGWSILLLLNPEQSSSVYGLVHLVQPTKFVSQHFVASNCIVEDLDAMHPSIGQST